MRLSSPPEAIRLIRPGSSPALADIRNLTTSAPSAPKPTELSTDENSTTKRTDGMFSSRSSVMIRFSRSAAAVRRTPVSSSAVLLQFSFCAFRSRFRRAILSSEYSISSSFFLDSSSRAIRPASSRLYFRDSLSIWATRFSSRSYSSGEKSSDSRKSESVSAASDRRNEASFSDFAAFSSSGTSRAARSAKYCAFCNRVSAFSSPSWR